MKQLELFGLEPIQTYLHVWTDAERARRIKKAPDTFGRTPCGGEPAEAGREKQADEAACQRITRFAPGQRQTHQDEADTGSRQKAPLPESPARLVLSPIGKQPADGC